MNLLKIWKWANYRREIGTWAYDFNSNQPRMHSAIEAGEHLWLVGARPDPDRTRYVLLAKLVVASKVPNPPDSKWAAYGRFRLVGDTRSSAAFAPDGPDASDLLLRLSFAPPKPVASRGRIGQALQTVRALAPRDDRLLAGWARSLEVLPVPAAMDED